MWSKMVVLRVFHTTSKHFSRSAASRYAYLLPPHVPHIDDVMPCVALSSYCFGVDQELAMWSKMVVLRVFHTPSKHFSRSAASRLVRLFTHPTRLTRASSDDMCFPCLARCCRVALARRGVQNGCFVCFSYSISKYFSRSTASKYAYLLLPHVPHIDDVTPCVALPSHLFGVDQELPTWSEIVVLRVFQIK